MFVEDLILLSATVRPRRRQVVAAAAAATVLAELEREMFEAAEALEFERAAALRDEIRELGGKVV